MKFKMTEVMVGEHKLCDDGKIRNFMFTVHWGGDLLKHLNPWSSDFLKFKLNGRTTADGLFYDAICDGTLDLQYLSGKIKYRFNIYYNGECYYFSGDKTNIKPWNIYKTHFVCKGDISNASGLTISTAQVKFKLSKLIPFLLSFRIYRG